jgi:hypothetical protein
MKKIILSMTFFLSIVLLQSCEKEKPSFKDEALTLAKECGLTSVSTPDKILEVEKIEKEIVLLKQGRKWHLNNEIKSYVDRYQLADPVIGTVLLTCNFKDMLFADSTYAEASGYWIRRDIGTGGQEGIEPFVFLLTNLKVVDKPKN